MKRLLLALALVASQALTAAPFAAWADGCYICQRDSSCGQYCKYSGSDNGDNRKKCTQAGCKIGGTASCPTGVNIKTCHAGHTTPSGSPVDRLRELAALPR
jgi:hypothetical protein